MKQSEERYRGIFENAVLGIFQSSPAGRLLKVNNAFASMHGYSTPDEMIAVTTDIATQHYVSCEDRLRFRDLLEEHGVVRHFEAAFYRKDGSTARLLMNARAVKDSDGRMLYYEGTVEDVTEHRRALDAQREGEERYRTVTENSNDGIAILRGDEYIYVNGRFIELFGYDHPDDFIGKPISTAIHPDDLAMVSENNRRRQRGEKIQPRYELKGIRKDGTSLHLDVSVARTIYSGQPVSLIYLRDITERKSLEDQLRQSQKMEAIGQLAGGIAHDFNNILTALIGYGSLLQMNMDEKDRLRVYVNQILASSQKAANLTQGLLAFSRKQTIALKPCSVNAIITNVESLLRRLLTEDIDLRLNLADKALTVMADSTQIEQVLLNLATNARDSMPSGGTLSIGISEVEPGGEPATITESGEAGAYALISVTDTGTGMDDRTREKIFEPFFTTKEAGRGTGLGLSIVYGIVKQHNGYITVASEPGSGTSFSIFLPIVKNILELTPRRFADIRGGDETILVAEDNTEARLLTREILTRSGYTVIEAVDGEDAVKRFMENRKRISLVILDVVMPRKNGKEVYETIKEMKPGIRTIFVSGYTDDVVIEKGINDRSVEFISKPVPIEELLSRIRAVLDS